MKRLFIGCRVIKGGVITRNVIESIVTVIPVVIPIPIAIALLLVGLTANGAARTADDARWDRLAGDWRGQPDATAIVDRAVHRATESMSVFTRGTARERLMSGHAPPARIRMARHGDLFTIQFDDRPALGLPISGASIQDGERTIRVQPEDGADGIRQIGETKQGQRVNIYRLRSTSDVMTMDATITSPRLPEPVHFTLEFTRGRTS